MPHHDLQTACDAKSHPQLPDYSTRRPVPDTAMNPDDVNLDGNPALLGGAPVRPAGPPPWPIADAAVEERLRQAYRDGSWGKYHGDYIPQLENTLRETFQVEHVLLCGSGTYAIELALRAVQAGAGTEVALAGYDYGGNFLCVHAVGAHPVLIEIDRDNWNLSIEAFEQIDGGNVRAILASHLHGGLIPMQRVCEWAHERGIAVIEDAAQAPGAVVDGRKAATWGDVGVVSFGGSKLLTAGRGGALLTNRADLYQRAKRESFRGNWVCPLSELQAAVLLPQLAALDDRNLARRNSVDLLVDSISDVEGIAPLRNRNADDFPVYYKVGWRYDADAFGLSREIFTKAMRVEGVAMDVGFVGLHVGRSPRRYRAAGSLDEAERAHHGAVVLHHPVLLGDEMDIKAIAAAIKKIAAHTDELNQLSNHSQET